MNHPLELIDYIAISGGVILSVYLIYRSLKEMK
jgi:hypothetical protein